MDYQKFLSEFDKKLDKCFQLHKNHIHCKPGCSACCEKGDYPISRLELEYLMQGFIKLENDVKIVVQKNIKDMEKGGVCPFLIENKCSIYKYRPIVCRIHGLCYLYKENKVKLPYCVNDKKNYSDVYENKEVIINPINENLDTPAVLQEFNYGEIRNLFDWLNTKTDN